MRKIITFLLFVTILIFALSACVADGMKIEDYEWKMRTIVHVENNQAVCDAVGEEITTHPEAKIIDMTLVAKDGKITITDVTNSKTYEGTYKVVQKTPAGTDYEVKGGATAFVFAKGQRSASITLKSLVDPEVAKEIVVKLKTEYRNSTATKESENSENIEICKHRFH